MFMNLVSKPIIINTIFTIILGACLSMVISFILPNKNFFPNAKKEEMAQSTFNLAKAFNLERKVQKASLENQQRETSKDFLLKDFIITGIFLDGDDSMVIVKDSTSGIFIYMNQVHKGYKLVEVYLKKARFKKGVHYYWSFLDPLDEKEFKENPQGHSSAIKSTIRKTVAVDMFEDIKFKNGEYYIPKDMLNDSAGLTRHLSSIGARYYNLNGKISFLITYVAPNSVFRKMGLRKNDEIIAANGNPFKSMNEPIKFYQNIKNAKNVSISIRRGNQTKELKYEVY
ncbi:PDZ domain-containing protein [Sulfurimonas sp.]